MKHNIPLIEPARELCNYHFYHFVCIITYNSIVLSNKRACRVTFFDSLFTANKKENKNSHQSIIFVSYCSSKSENLVEFDRTKIFYNNSCCC